MTEVDGMTLLEGIQKLFSESSEHCPDIQLSEERFFQAVYVGGEWVPVLSFRTNPKIVGMKALDVLGRPCALTAMSVCNERLERILFQELDIAEYLLDSETEHITAYRAGSSANLIAGFMNGATAHMQLHSTPFGTRQFHHELITDQGMVSDRVVDTVIAQQALNLYSADGYEFYTDSDLLLYGLSCEEQELAYGIFECFHTDASARVERGKRLSRIVAAALSDSRTCRLGVDF